MAACSGEKLPPRPLEFIEIQDTPSGTHCPALNPDADVTHEEVLQIEATAPGMIGLEVAVVFPVVSCKNIGAPKRDVKFSVRVPLRARRRSYLFHFLPGILSSRKSG